MANEQRHLSPAGANFIAGFEGCILHPYNDPDNATIGIGHLIHLGPVTEADIERYRGFTRAEALRLLQADVHQTEDEIRARVIRQLGQHQWDALVSLVFNCGPGVIAGGIGQDINEGAFAAAADAWQAWVHDSSGAELAGLVRRREAERQLFLEHEAPYVPPDEQRWESEYDQLAHKHGPWPALRRRVLRRYMTTRRKKIWHLAQKTGWEQLNRADRYRKLLARTE
ncbi:MAG TPA: lysozyme [Opitutaceae bacterium]|nr:lysozyme [Opitutaceae bacterium]